MDGRQSHEGRKVPIAPEISGWLDLLAPPALLGSSRECPLPSTPAHTSAWLKQMVHVHYEWYYNPINARRLRKGTHLEEFPRAFAVNGGLRAPAGSPTWPPCVSFRFPVRVRIWLQIKEAPGNVAPAMHIDTSSWHPGGKVCWL